MKQFILSILSLSLVACSATAQKFYARAGAGFAIPVAGQNLSQNGWPYSGTMTYVAGQNDESQLASFESRKISFNTGIQAHIGIGYMFNKNVGVDLGLIAGLSHSKHELAAQFPEGPYAYKQSFTRYANMPLIVTPSIVLQSEGKTVKVYTRAGLALPAKARITHEIGQTRSVMPLNLTAETLNITEELSTSPAIGLSGAIGVKYLLSDRIYVTLEVSAISLSVNAKRSELTNYLENGEYVDLSQIPDRYRYTNYSSSYEPGSVPTYSIPFSNASFNVGIAMDLN